MAGLAAQAAGGPPERLRCDSAVVARRAFRLLRAVGLKPRLRLLRGRRRLRFELEAMPTARWQHGLGQAWSWAPDRRPADFLRGAFLRWGFLRRPADAYHWEVRIPLAQLPPVERALGRLGVKGGVNRRRGRATCYVKDREQVRRLLIRLGGHRQALEVDSAEVMKGVRGRVNRLVNLETANLQRTVASGYEQRALLARLRGDPRWGQLDAGLRAVAEQRLAHPDWSLAELGRSLSPPLSKSAVNHRLRRLRRLFQDGDQRP